MICPGVQQNIRYFKRFRMEIDLQVSLPPLRPLSPGYTLVAWEECLLEEHAEVKFQSFVDEVDAVVFPSLSSREGCLRLMREITGKPGFKPEATWLIACEGSYCGTVQGVRDRTGMGAIQNLGVMAEHRGRGLGKALMLHALHGFQRAGAHRVHLEVTASNDAAICLYRRIGFRCRKTIYKPVDALAALQTAPRASEWFI